MTGCALPRQLETAGANDVFTVWDAAVPADRAAWLAAWNAWARRDVFAHPGYQELSAGGTTRAMCASLTTDAGAVLFPFLLQDLAPLPCWDPDVGPAYDVTTNGYVGAFRTSESGEDELAARFWQRFDAWSAATGVVSEFVRMSVDANQLLPYPGEQATKRNIVRSLDLEEPELWKDVRHKVRKNVKRARSEGVTVEVDPCGDRLDEFLAVYDGTMGRRSVASQDAQAAEYFARLCRSLPGNFAFLHAMHGGQVVSSELVLFGAENAYSFLGGTDERHFEMRPNDLLKYEIILWARSQGLRQYVLGGGRSPDDGIYRYKESFAPHGVVDYRVGWRVPRPEAYRRLSARSPGAGQTEYSPNRTETYFPAYRKAA
ncbi:MAG: GNAT family N-acetyltransferase [Pirellulales bacterium]|nr:GNAT family N-acetyltransferase [Pirellulales bacterium]